MYYSDAERCQVTLSFTVVRALHTRIPDLRDFDVSKQYQKGYRWQVHRVFYVMN